VKRTWPQTTIAIRRQPDLEMPCLEWQGRRDADGYGWQWDPVAKRDRKVHRMAWEKVHGRPATTPILHRCDNPPCVEPTHLWAGSLTENTRDMVLKGRSRFRGDHGLSLEQARAIRARVAAGEVQRAIARELGLHFTTVNRIVKGRTWKEVRPTH
jgi:HNH endonuclease